MKLRLNAQVRHSLAEVLKKLADRGGVVFGLLGWASSSGTVLVGMGIWWVFLQALAHLLLAIEE